MTLAPSAHSGQAELENEGAICELGRSESRQTTWMSRVTSEVNSEFFSEERCVELDGDLDFLDIDGMITYEYEETLKNAVDMFPTEGEVCVSIRHPSETDSPVIAVSDNFEKITGYRRHEVVGKSCRFLDDHCTVDWDAFARRQAAQATGSQTTAVVLNQRKTGEHFVNLVSSRGLVVAERNPDASEGGDRVPTEKMLLVEIHADITNIPEGCVRDRVVEKFADVVERIHSKTLHLIGEMAIAGMRKIDDEFRAATLRERESWRLLPQPHWKMASTAPRARDEVWISQQQQQQHCSRDVCPKLGGCAVGTSFAWGVLLASGMSLGMLGVLARWRNI